MKKTVVIVLALCFAGLLALGVCAPVVVGIVSYGSLYRAKPHSMTDLDIKPLADPVEKDAPNRPGVPPPPPKLRPAGDGLIP